MNLSSLQSDAGTLAPADCTERPPGQQDPAGYRPSTVAAALDGQDLARRPRPPRRPGPPRRPDLPAGGRAAAMIHPMMRQVRSTDEGDPMSNIRYEVDDGVAIITIDRPEKRNAMTYAVLGEFFQAIGRAGADETAKAVVLTGAGGAFCAGTDLSDLASRPTSERGSRPSNGAAHPGRLGDPAVPQAGGGRGRRSRRRDGRRIHGPMRRTDGQHGCPICMELCSPRAGAGHRRRIVAPPPPDRPERGAATGAVG